MINLYSSHPTSSFVVYPDTFNEISESTNKIYRLQLTQSIDLSTALVTPLRRINTQTSNKKSQLIVLQAYSGSGVPSYDGQYTAKLQYGEESGEQWGSANYLFGSYHVRFGEKAFSGSTLSTDRAFVHGTNIQEITNYISPNEDGQYTTYNS